VEEIIGKPVAEFSPEWERPKAFESMKRVFSGEQIRSMELVSQKRNGELIYLEYTALPFIRDGKIVSIYGVARDITQRKQVEKALAESEERYRLIFQNAPIGISHYDQSGLVTGINPKGLEILQTTNEQVGGFNLLHQDQHKEISDAILSSLSGKPGYYEGEFISSISGRYFIMRSYFNPIFSDQNQIVGGICMMEDITQEYLARQLLAESEERFRLLAESSSDGIFQTDLNGIYTYASPAYAEILNYPVNEIMGSHYARFLAEGEIMPGQEVFYKLLSKETIKSYDTKIIRKDGRECDVSVGSTPIIKNGQVVNIQGVVRDVTEQKKAERALAESEEKFRLLAEGSSDGIFQMDLNGIFTYVSPSFAETYQYSADEIVGTNYLQFIVEHKHMEVQELFHKLLAKEKIKSQDSTIIRKDGREVEINVSSAPVIKDGRVVAIQGVMRDITEQKKSDMKLAESEEKYRLIFNSAPVGITQFDNNSVVTAINPKALWMVGLSEQEVLGFNFFEKVKDDRMLTSVKMALDGSTSGFQGDYRSTISGNTLYLDLFTAPIVAADNSIKGGIMMIKDITEQIRAQKELKESQKNLTTLFDAITESVLLVDPEGVILAVNQTAAQRLHTTTDHILGKNAFDFLPEDVAKFRKAKLTEVARTGKPVSFEDIRYGRHVWTNFYPIFDADGHVNRIAVFTLDIHERKTAEQELAKFKKISDMANYGTGILTMDGRFVYVNQTFAKLHGYDPGELIDQYLTLLHTEEQMVHVKDLRKRLFKEDGFVGEEVWHKKKDGSIFPMLMNAFVLKNETGTPQLLTVTAIDITEIKKAEESLRESEKKYRLIFDSSPLGIFHYNENGVIQDCNLKTLELSGSSLEKLVGFNLLENLTEELFLNAIRNSLAGISGELEGKYRSITGGKESYLRAFTVPIHSEDGSVKGGMCVAEDVSEKVLFEKALQESEKRYRVLFENAPVAIGVSDFEGNIKDFNSQLLKLYGYSEAEAWSLRIRDAYNDAADREKCLNELNEYGKVVNKDVKFKRKNGDILDVLVSMNIIELENQKYILGIYRDVTEKKQAEDALSQSHEKLRNLTKYLQSARENERTNIARELHDELGQVLTAINMEAAWVAQKLPEGQDKIKPRAEAISDMAVGAIGVVKRIISELRPTLLTDLGLAAAIKWQAEEYQRRIGIRFEVNIDPEEIMVDEDLAIAIFRIFQEATTNAIRHAHATAVRVSLKEKQGQIELAVKDNGIGITEDKINLNNAYGILGMKERAQVFNGSLEVSGLHGKGTTIRARFPI
jgi:PAS domain S-box-containing protein